jgi:predicted Zn-dependent protease
MQSYFYDLADHLKTLLKGSEVYTAYLAGESSDFCRLNGAKVRQAGSVKQSQLTMKLIAPAPSSRSADATVELSGDKAEDRARIAEIVKLLREQIAVIPADPFLMYATDVRSSELRRASELPDSGATIAKVAEAAKGLDMVGIYAAGLVYRGFANSFGQRNWFETHSFNLDWSFYLRADKAVKTGYAGMRFDDQTFARKVDDAKAQLSVLNKEPRTLKPGRYRVYLSPSALTEVTTMLGWGGFSLKAHKTKQTSLIKMVEDGQKMNPGVTMRENTKDGLAPNFNAAGFTKPDHVTFIEGGTYRDSLVSPRSAKEYGVATNGAGGDEAPESFDILPGQLKSENVLSTLKDGLYLNNLWYLNFSDRQSCRVTGMTRFASFQVENGKITAPLNVMRFDESILRLFGDNLEALTSDTEMILSASTYGQRSTGSDRLPGALVNDFALTL